MNDFDDTHLDAALEALARPEPPGEHVATVLARSGPTAGSGLQAAGSLRPRWMLPVAATVLAAIGLAWQASRQADGDGHDARQESGVSVVAERTPTLPAAPGVAPHDQEPDTRDDGAAMSGPQPARASRAVRPARGSVTEVELAWVPVPSGLPPIELEPITPAPIEIAPIAALEAITVEDITLAPIVVAPVDEQEKP